MEAIELEILYTPADIQKAQRLHLVRNRKAKIRLGLFMVFGILLIIEGMLFIGIKISDRSAEAIWLPVVLILAGIFIIGYYVWYLRNVGKKVYNKSRQYHTPLSFIISRDKIEVKARNINSRMDWEYFEHAVISNDLILLFPNRVNMYIFPKKYFSGDDFSRFKAWVHQKVKCV